MKKSILIFLTIVCTNIAFAQVSKKTIVEHFTNTKCSICASRNPGLNANLNANPNVLRISIHPSSPYANCFLSQQNTSDNDARTNYYNVYGGTPKLVINGTAISTSQNYADAAMFTPFVSQTPFTISIQQFAVGQDSIRSEISIKRIAAGAPIGNASLFAALVEDTVFGNGGNGENLHFNVMRRALFTPQGQLVTLPVNIGDSIVMQKTESFNSTWNNSRMRTVAILQDDISKEVIQSELSSTQQIVATSLNALENEQLQISVYPVPASYYVNLYMNKTTSFNYSINNQYGQQLQNGKISNGQKINISQLSDGIYFIIIANANCTETLKFIVQK